MAMLEKNKIDVFTRMTDEMKKVLEIQNERSKGVFDTGADFKELREAYVKERTYWNEGGPVMVQTKNAAIAGPFGDIPVRFHYPDDTRRNACTLFIHGGGFVVGSPETHDRMMRIFAKLSGTIVAAIDYRLAPEHKFPVAVNECTTIVRYLMQFGEQYGVDEKNLSIAGDSGGANLALATALLLRDSERATFPLKSLILYYGLYGLRDSVSRRLLGGEWDGLSKKDLDYYNDCYLSKKEDTESPYFDCLSADLSYGIPPVYMAVGDLDPLLDDSLVLCKILNEQGLLCECQVFEGLLHAFLHYTKQLPEANEALKQGADFLRKRLV